MPDPAPVSPALVNLDNISIVLVRTKSPANIGAVARAMMNMGLSRLILVRPPQDDGGEAIKIAAGAETILRNAKTFPTLAEAIAGYGLVFGTSRHTGRQRKNVKSPHTAASEIIAHAARSRAAIVFGREINGLDNEDLALCHEIIRIPTSDAFPSLNLSHAVMIAAYEIFVASLGDIPSSERELAPTAELEGFYRHLSETLQDIGFIDPEHPERMMFTLRQIYGRARLDAREVNILRGILRQFDWALKTRKKGEES